MQKSQAIVLAGAIALCGLLYSFPKVIVSGKEKLQAGNQAAQATPAEASTHASSLSPDQATALNELRAAYLRSTDTEKKVTFADSLSATFRQFSQFDSAAYYSDAVAVTKPSVANWLKAGNSFYDAQNFATDAQQAGKMGEKAREYYQKVLATQPSLLDVKARMAMTYVSTNNPMQGITLLREVLQQDPDNQTALINLGLLSIRSGQYDKAADRFTQVLTKDPGNEQAQFYLGISYAEMGKADKAKPLLQQIKNTTNDPVMRSTADEYLKNLK